MPNSSSDRALRDAELRGKLAQVKARIDASAKASARDAADITLVAVSKTRPAQDISLLYEAGQRSFGESYVQEAVPKISILNRCTIEWHFIGRIQSNKTREIARYFDWVHSVDRIEIARRLSRQRPHSLAPLNVCIQVNISREPSKAGVTPDEVADLVAAIYQLPGMNLRGLMTIAPRNTTNRNTNRRQDFQELNNLRSQLERGQGVHLDTLSMGMSGDLEDAVRFGATIVRVGSAIFGVREP
jgi:pyridoxal phosphate enzyme (YggS family)